MRFQPHTLHLMVYFRAWLFKVKPASWASPRSSWVIEILHLNSDELNQNLHFNKMMVYVNRGSIALGSFKGPQTLLLLGRLSLTQSGHMQWPNLALPKEHEARHWLCAVPSYLCGGNSSQCSALQSLVERMAETDGKGSVWDPSYCHIWPMNPWIIKLDSPFSLCLCHWGKVQ